MKKENIVLLTVLLFIYALIAYIGYYTPMHSDDFPYSVIGLEPSRHFNHYMTWSGRVVADYVSTLILMTNNHLAIALINSFGSALLIYNIASLPAAIDKSFNKFKIALLSLAVFVIYWVGNPNLGQVMFWVVGSANYMWTTLCIIFMIRTLLRYKESENDNTKNSCYLFTISVIAGCTNENTSVTAVAMVFAILTWYRFNDGFFHKGLIAAFGGVITGALVMILAPGNFARASGHSLDAWRDSSLVSKAFVLLFETLPKVMVNNWLVFLSIITVLLVIAFKPHVNKKAIALAAGFMLCFLCANIVMIAAPGYPPRTMNGQFIFLLCAFAMLASQIKKPLFEMVILCISTVLMVYFIPSYYSMVINYKSAYAQSFVRTAIIEKAIKSGANEVTIPNWNFRRFFKGSDVFDTYHSPWMYLYYRSDIKKINVYPVGFDYSIITKKPRFNTTGLSINGVSFSGVYAYDDSLNNQVVFVAESELPLKQGDTYRLFIHPVLMSGTVVKNGTSLPFRTISVDNRNFTYVRVKGVSLKDVKSIKLGHYEVKTGKTISEYHVD
ncbi:hypothetical protein LSI80_003828 [Escherichia coli]|uniref:DUF3329 domain-containing protein n=1 Tax=Escherichia coli TaxID=562 RepID=UPI000CF070F6|nr:DUF6056 family protein [Escherichia coli]EFE9360670.1 hypothetical protein [Escherichia coli]EIP3936995.1 hypothetical protein [Escherichia coli]PPX58359.1 hypothetical protein C5P07_15770 [Escherichia coli]HAJ0507321.1 hypothetical protein [Escherichia coli]